MLLNKSNQAKMSQKMYPKFCMIELRHLSFTLRRQGNEASECFVVSGSRHLSVSWGEEVSWPPSVSIQMGRGICVLHRMFEAPEFYPGAIDYQYFYQALSHNTVTLNLNKGYMLSNMVFVIQILIILNKFKITFYQSCLKTVCLDLEL